MSDIKIFVTHSPDKDSVRVKNALFYHVAAGSALRTKPVPAEMLADDEGEHISNKNKSYCELTTQYWAWKNVEADYYGFCHYRRYFSFASDCLQEADCGCLVYPRLDMDTRKKLRLSEQDIIKRVEPYDFLIAKAVPSIAFGAKNVRCHYKNAKDLHVEDLDLLLALIRGKYPYMERAAQSYLYGKVFYPCNMFVMKKELFERYCAILFDLLEEWERRADMSHYSREGYRTPGHLGERFLGIFYNYLLEQETYRMGELQMALIEDTSPKSVRLSAKDAEKPVVPVVLAANEAYVPVLYTCIQSIFNYAQSERNYEIYIFYTDIAQESRESFIKLCTSGFQITFVNVSEQISRSCIYGRKHRGKRRQLDGKGHITKETYYRFFIPELMQRYEKVIYLDADMIICKDIAHLYDIDLADCYLAAAADIDLIGQYNGANPDTRQYCERVLQMKDIYRYFQAGVLVWNMKAWNKKKKTKRLFQMAGTGKYRYSDQDILNIVCEGHVKQLDMAWNVLADHMHYRLEHVIRYAPHQMLDAYEAARNNPFIIHYAGEQKPWKDPKADYAAEFWSTARETPYYETLLCEIKQSAQQKKKPGEQIVHISKHIAKKILPKGSWIRRAVGGLYWKLK